MTGQDAYPEFLPDVSDGKVRDLAAVQDRLGWDWPISGDKLRTADPALGLIHLVDWDALD